MSLIRNSARDFLYIVFKRKKLIIWINVSIFLIILIYSILQTPMYTMTSEVFIQGIGYQENLFGDRSSSNPALAPFSADRLNTEIAVITSWPVCERIVSLYNLQHREIENPTFRDEIKNIIKWPKNKLIESIKQLLGIPLQPSEAFMFHKAVDVLRGNINAAPYPVSRVITISYSDRDPILGTKIVNSLTDEYLNQHMILNINEGKSSFYKEQINTVREKLAIMQDQFSKFKSREELISFDDQEKGLLNSINSYNNSLTDVRKKIISERNKLEKMHAYMREHPDKLIPSKDLLADPLLSQLNKELVQLQLKLSSLLQKYTPENRNVVDVKSQIEEYEKQIKEQVNKQLDLEKESLDKLVAEENALEAIISDLNVVLLTLPKKEITYNALEESVKQQQQLLQGLTQKYQEALVEEASDKRSRMVKVIEYATVPIKPSSPRLLLNFLIAIMLGPLLSSGLVLLLEYLDHSIDTPEDSKHYLNLPVLGSVDEV